MTKQALEHVLKIEKIKYTELKTEYERVAKLATTYANVIDDLRKKLNCYEAHFESVKKSSNKKIVRCKDCRHDGLISCPIAYIEKQTLCFINHDADFYCAKGEIKKKGK